MPPPPWLHNKITREDAEALVTEAGLDDGRFLLRTREGKKGEYVLCVVYKGKPTHHLCSKNEEGLYAVNKKTYGGHEKISALVAQLSKKTAGWPVPLDKPVHSLMAVQEPTMETFFGDVWKDFEKLYESDTTRAGIIKRDIARWAFTGVFNGSHLDTGVRQRIGELSAKFEQEDFEAAAKAAITKEAEADWDQLHPKAYYDALKIKSPEEVLLVVKETPQDPEDGGERRGCHISAKKFKPKGNGKMCILIFTKPGFVAHFYLTDNAIGSRVAKLKLKSEVILKRNVKDMLRDHYHAIETGQLTSQTGAAVKITSPAGAESRETTVEVDGSTEVDGYASGFAIGDSENGAFESNLDERLDMCAARVYLSRHIYKCSRIDEADGSHRLMMLNFVALLESVLEYFVDLHLDCLSPEDQAELHRDWEKDQSGGFLRSCLF